MRSAGAPLGGVTARLAAAAGMLAATAVAVLSLGALGVLGPLGSLIAGGERSDLGDGSTRGNDRPGAAIVAAPSLVALTPVRATTRTKTPPATGKPVAQQPATTTPAPAAPNPAPQTPAQSPQPPTPTEPPTPPEPPAPPQPPKVVDTAATTVDRVADQTPEPVRGTVHQVTDTLRETCAQLQVCP